MAKKRPQKIKLPTKIPQLPEEQVEIAALKDHPRNYKKHPPAQLEHIAHNIRLDGIWKNVVISKDDYILGGHGVVAAARLAGVKSAPVRRLRYKHTHPRALAIVIADNETARLAETLIFSCPPYGDLEVYSEDPRDLSTLEYARFVDKFREIVAAALARLKPDRFACFVVGDIRAPDGTYRGFVPDTHRAFHDAGARLYNEAVLVTAVGSLPIRTTKQFAGSRKLGKTHQNVLVFCKGDPVKATKACGKVDVADPAEGFGEVLGAAAAA